MGSLRRLLAAVCFAWVVLVALPPAFTRVTDVPVRGALLQSLADEPPGLTAHPAVLPRGHGEVAEASPFEPEFLAPGPAGRTATLPSPHRRAVRMRDRARPLPGSDILLLIQRQNE